MLPVCYTVKIFFIEIAYGNFVIADNNKVSFNNRNFIRVYNKRFVRADEFISREFFFNRFHGHAGKHRFTYGSEMNFDIIFQSFDK